MGLNLSRFSTFSRLIAVCICWLLSIHARAGYVLVQSLDEVAEGGQFLITSEPSLTSGCMLGNTYNSKSYYIEGISLNNETEESQYVEWTITINNISTEKITCEVLLDDKRLGLTNNLEDLSFSTYQLNSSWELSAYNIDGITAFQLKMPKTLVEN